MAGGEQFVSRVSHALAWCGGDRHGLSDVIVIGAGLAGLAASEALAQLEGVGRLFQAAEVSGSVHSRWMG